MLKIQKRVGITFNYLHKMSNLFNLSDMALEALSGKAMSLASQSMNAVGSVNYNCVCCGGGSCATGIAGD